MAFSMLGVPKEVKTDNGPAYISAKLKKNFQQWGIQHSTGIPHSPMGQPVVETAHQTQKRILAQQQGGTDDNSPLARLCKALFTINF